MSKQTSTITPPDEADEALRDVVTVEKPSVGRIVLVNVAIFGDLPVMRPAVVTNADLGDDYAPDAISVAVFLAPTDHPVPSGLSIKQVDVGTPNYPRYTDWSKPVCRYGTFPGGWTWPERTDEPATFTV